MQNLIIYTMNILNERFGDRFVYEEVLLMYITVGILFFVLALFLVACIVDKRRKRDYIR